MSVGHFSEQTFTIRVLPISPTVDDDAYAPTNIEPSALNMSNL